MIDNIESRNNNRNTRKSQNSRIRPMFDDLNDYYFEHDHAPAHTAYLTRDWLNVWVPNHLSVCDKVPPKLDDLWAIERIWGILTGRVYREPVAKTIEELEQRVRDAWDELDSGLLKRTMHQMRLRVETYVSKVRN